MTNVTKSVTIPTIPTNIVKMRISLLKDVRCGVIPSERPVVLNAEKTSNAIDINPFPLSYIDTKKTDVLIHISDNAMIAKALCTDCREISDF